MVFDLFSGCGGVSRQIRRRGFRAREFEINLDPSLDLTDPKLVDSLVGQIKSNMVRSVMLATPCTTFTTARDRNSQIRSRHYLWGIPGLPDRLRQKVLDGNRCAKTSIRIILACLESGVPCILENPASSRLFLLKPLQALMKKNRDKVHFIVADFCQYGTRWRKSTGFLCVNFQSHEVAGLGKRCKTCKGLCSRTHAPHQVLSGTAPGGTPWTRIAQPYPSKLCAKLADLLVMNRNPSLPSHCCEHL